MKFPPDDSEGDAFTKLSRVEAENKGQDQHDSGDVMVVKEGSGCHVDG